MSILKIWGQVSTNIDVRMPIAKFYMKLDNVIKEPHKIEQFT
jgi:hypothetical protein